MKNFFSVLLILTISICTFIIPVNAQDVTDYDVLIMSTETAEPGETIDVTVSVTDIKAKEGGGILAATVYLFYDSYLLTPAEGSFQGVAPKGWDVFDGTASPGVWALHAVFSGDLESKASKDGDISFSVSFKVLKTAEPQSTHFYVYNCEGTEYSESALLKLKSFESSAYSDKELKIIAPQILIPYSDDSFIIDRENGIIYSETDSLTYNDFASLFSKIGGDLTISAYDYNITEENGKYIPNGAVITVYHIPSETTFTFQYLLLGDCDCNGEVNTTDLALVKLVIINNIPVEGQVMFAMEFEKDGIIRIADYLRLKRHIQTK